jgi:transmembrane sensor
MQRPLQLKLNAQIYDEASTWFVDARAGDLDDASRREFDRWLRRSPEHLSAYLEIAAIWNEGSGLDPAHRWDVDTLMAQAREDSGNVVPLPASAAAPGLAESVPRSEPVTSRTQSPLLERENNSHPAPLGRGRGWAPQRRKRIALAASVAALTALGAVWIWFALFSGVYSTAIGEQRSIELADGSTVEMNSKSRIRVHYAKNERAVDLLEGQALFHVAKDRARPFIVRADGTRVRAVGTEFDVYEKKSGTLVTVVEGEVAVLAPTIADTQRQPQGSAALDELPVVTISVSAGEQLMVTSKLARKADQANVAAATAWTERRIVFESATLAEVAEEFNRYNERQLVIDDRGLYDFHISGVFSSTDPESLIRFLRERPGVTVSEEGSEIRISKNI